MAKKLALKIETIDFEIHSLKHLLSVIDFITTDKISLNENINVIKSFPAIQSRIYDVCMQHEKRYVMKSGEYLRMSAGPGNTIALLNFTRNWVDFYQKGVLIERWNYPNYATYYYFDLRKNLHVLCGTQSAFRRSAYADNKHKTLVDIDYKENEIPDGLNFAYRNGALIMNEKTIYQNSHMIKSTIVSLDSILILCRYKKCKREKYTLLIINITGKVVAKYHPQIPGRLKLCVLLNDMKTICYESDDGKNLIFIEPV